LASQGKALFSENCAYCHAPNPKKPEDSFAPARNPEWRMRIVPTS